ncbi:hypothetical protein J3459_008549 [Metarhizium acridum]|nr:hypothetical protein J3459_008549 [Metarhizium acridum]
MPSSNTAPRLSPPQTPIIRTSAARVTTAPRRKNIIPTRMFLAKRVSAMAVVTAPWATSVPLAKDTLPATTPITARLMTDVDGAEPSRRGPFIAAADLAAVNGAAWRQSTVLQRAAWPRALVCQALPFTRAPVAGAVPGILRRAGDDGTRVNGAVAVCASLGLAAVGVAVLQVFIALPDPCVLASRLYAGVYDGERLSVFVGQGAVYACVRVFLSYGSLCSICICWR